MTTPTRFRLPDSKVLVTGATGFLGQHLIHILEYGTGVRELVTVGGPAESKPRLEATNGFRGYVDLTEPAATEELFESEAPDVVFHLAGFNGGIEYNRRFPADIFLQNTLMACNVIRASAKAGVKKVISTISSCAYPDEDEALLREADFLAGPPHPSVACHAYAKRALFLASYFAHVQYDLLAPCVALPTLYGPGERVDDTRAKVIGGLIGRFVRARDRGDAEVACWGSGNPLREFLYVEDAARLLCWAMEQYHDCSQLLNIGPGTEVSIRELAETVAKVVGYQGTILWDTTKADGQFRKKFATDTIERLIPDMQPTSLLYGLRASLQWYEQHGDPV